MNGDAKKPNVIPVNPEPSTAMKPKSPNRRQFLGGVEQPAAAATVATIGLEPLIVEEKSQPKRISIVSYPPDTRADESFHYRTETARAERVIVREQPGNGGFQGITDFSGNFQQDFGSRRPWCTSTPGSPPVPIVCVKRLGNLRIDKE